MDYVFSESLHNTHTPRDDYQTEEYCIDRIKRMKVVVRASVLDFK